MSWDDVPAGMYGDADEDASDTASTDAQPTTDDV